MDQIPPADITTAELLQMAAILEGAAERLGDERRPPAPVLKLRVVNPRCADHSRIPVDSRESRRGQSIGRRAAQAARSRWGGPAARASGRGRTAHGGRRARRASAS